MGFATGLGSLAFFIVLWVAMMAAMMLPGAAPALVRRARSGGPLTGVPLFAATYLGVWALLGLYRPHGTVAAGVITMAAGVYELTPLKRRFRRHCRDSARTGLVLGVMSVPWMIVIAVLVTFQKLMPAKAVIDVPVALAIVGLEIAILAR